MISPPGFTSSRFRYQFIDVAIPPFLPRLERLDHRVVRVTKMLGGMLVFRTVAAPHVPAGFAKAQLHPGIAGLQTLFATIRLRPR
jgi:hypothetical protein